MSPFLAVGLGNPGPDYEETRHNLGFEAVDRVAETLSATWRRGAGRWLEALADRKGVRVLLQKPMTYMNLSGDAVASFVAIHRPEPERILIVCDDIDLPLGKLRLRKRGGAGGQKGLLSILEILGTEEVPRLRLGIGPKTGDASDFVLSPFDDPERPAADEMLSRAKDLILELPGSDLDQVMNRYNR
ncbi:MAG: aminoacyl-tRNA hydrolase [Gemmatimonadetes bacterium]|nr:aminoacyl-tRNA hydrolase [Gemmatimonadota bacterium]